MALSSPCLRPGAFRDHGLVNSWSLKQVVGLPNSLLFHVAVGDTWVGDGAV